MIMLRKFWNSLKKFWNGYRENFLIVEQRNGGYQVTLASRNLRKKKIVIKKRFPLKNLSGLRHPLGGIGRIVFSLNSRSATTAESIITLKRFKPEESINEGEMDQLIYQVFWSFLNRHRGLAPKKMRTNGENLVLAYVQVREVYLGIHKIFNPIGFRGKELSLKLRGTFVPREILPVLERFKKWGEIFVFEQGSALSLVLPNGVNLLVNVGEDVTTVFKSAEGEQVFCASENWGTNLFAKSAAFDLGVDESTAQSIVDWYFENRVSVHVKRYLEVKFNKDFQKLADWLDSVKKDSDMNRPKLHFSFRYGPLVSSGYLRKLGGVAVRVDEELARQEFVLKSKRRAVAFNPPVEQEILALLTFEYALPKFDFLNQLLKRRVRWLIPNF